MKKTLLSFLATALLSALSFGQQKISFEPSEGYTLGTVVGQKEWTVKTDNVPNNNFKVVTGKASDGNNSVEVTSTGNYTENFSFLFKKIPEYNRLSVSADVKLEKLNSSDYYMLSLYYNNNGNYSWAGGFNFMYSGKLYADSDVNFLDLGNWTPEKWYNLRIEIDHVTEKNVKYYLDGQLVHTSTLGPKVVRANDLNFEFDNDGSGFVVDNIIIKDMDQLSVSDISKTQINIFPNPTSNFINIKSNEIIKSVKLYNASGSLIKTENANLSKIDISTFPKGNYLISIETDSGIETKKIIKE
ncbi:T9SS type A sorting domain-containing protein [Epilithonimonas hungarica]|uniref:Por secretion system C-terminal sorting domain-containing protein n=1 Tax=Epilithonimonas hungarica TaxID=454006 RepID=A0A1G7FX69_9FLAO|nr:T9SS type A sorting domain-containing protein [Epilithonimonas hungarica]SDE80518.1 Por secretion system C-terminal sorting domain-containing protein [Epilithonimonas hungarica]